MWKYVFPYASYLTGPQLLDGIRLCISPLAPRSLAKNFTGDTARAGGLGLGSAKVKIKVVMVKRLRAWAPEPGYPV